LRFRGWDDIKGKPLENRVRARLRAKKRRDARLREEAAEEARPHRVIYFIQQGDQPYVKIGIAADFVRRVDALQTASPHALRVLAYFPGTPRVERELHVRFGHLRMLGEWFHLAPEVVEYIGTLEPSAWCKER
jgi:hypothetical protein